MYDYDVDMSEADRDPPNLWEGVYVLLLRRYKDSAANPVATKMVLGRRVPGT